MIIIAKILSITFIIIISIIGLLSIITLATSSKPLEYTILNPLDCPPLSLCEYTPVSDLTLPTKEYFTNKSYIDVNGYSTDVSRMCMELINRAYLNNSSEDIKNIDFKDNFFSDAINDGKEFCNILKSDGILWIIFRGTEKLTEWITNFKLTQTSYSTSSDIANLPVFLNEDNPKIMVHDGFLKLYSDIREKILKNITENYDENSFICVSGHSLGGAIATITALDLKSLGYDNTVLYTYASPRVGNYELSNHIDRVSNLRHYRVINNVDIIPQMPLPVSPNPKQYDAPYFYQHNGLEYSFQKYKQSITNNHSIITYTKYINEIKYINRE